MKLGIRILLGSVVLAGCNTGLEPGEPPLEPEFRIGFDAPYRSGLHVMLGGSGQVSAKVLDRRDRPVTPDEGPTFRSTNSATLTVDASGHFTAVGWNTGPAALVAEARVGSLWLTKAISVSISCTTELRVSLSPTSKTLDLGERFTPSAGLSTCGGQVPVSSIITWWSSDSTILSVDSATGETTALKSGSASVQVRSESHHAMVAAIPVTVR